MDVPMGVGENPTHQSQSITGIAQQTHPALHHVDNQDDEEDEEDDDTTIEENTDWEGIVGRLSVLHYQFKYALPRSTLHPSPEGLQYSQGCWCNLSARTLVWPRGSSLNRLY